MQPLRTDTAWPRPPFWLRIQSLPERIVGFVMIATTIVGVAVYAGGQTEGTPLGSYAALAVGAIACLTAWRWQWATLILAAASPLIAGISGAYPIIEWNLTVFATFALTMRGMSIWLSIVPALGGYIGTALYYGAPLSGWSGFAHQEAIVPGFSTIVFAALGASILTSRRYWEQVNLRSRELSDARDIALARGVAEERLRIARDLHDVIGHEIAVVNMHLGAAEVHLGGENPAAASDISAARGGIQQVLTETQRILKVLRTNDEPSTVTGVGLLSDYAGIPALVEQCQRAGIAVEAAFPDAEPPLEPEASRAAFRVVQECLTNATKHGMGSVALHIKTAPGWLEIESVNRRDTDEPPRHGPGYGLVGMRERVTSVGGTLNTSDDAGLFWVRARLPLATTTTPEHGEAS